MPAVSRSTARQDQSRPDVLDYLAIEPEFRYNDRYLDGDDTNTYLLPSDVDGLQSEIAALARRMRELATHPLFYQLSDFGAALRMSAAAKGFLEPKSNAPRKGSGRASPHMTEEEIAFADEIGKVVTERWPRQGMRGVMRAAEFILKHYGKDGKKAGSVLENPLFRAGTILRIDTRLYTSYMGGLRPERLVYNPGDNLELRGQGEIHLPEEPPAPKKARANLKSMSPEERLAHKRRVGLEGQRRYLERQRSLKQ